MKLYSRLACVQLTEKKYWKTSGLWGVWTSFILRKKKHGYLKFKIIFLNARLPELFHVSFESSIIELSKES